MKNESDVENMDILSCSQLEKKKKNENVRF